MEHGEIKKGERREHGEIRTCHWLVSRLQRWADTNITLAFEDAKVISPFSREVTDDTLNTYDTADADDTNATDDTDNTDDTADTDDTVDAYDSDDTGD